MAPTICCRGDVSSKFHRRREKGRQGGGGVSSPPRQQQSTTPPSPGEGDAAPRTEEDGDPASLRGTVLMSAPAPADVSGAQPDGRRDPKSPADGDSGGPAATPALLMRKVASVRRRRRRGGGVAATWFRRRADEGAVTSDAAISTTTKQGSAAGRRSDEEWATWSAEWCEGRQGPRDGLKGSGGLLGITVRTVELMRRNQLLQWRLSLLQEETRAFVQSVLSNPENRRGRDSEGEAPSSGDQDPAVSGSI